MVKRGQKTTTDGRTKAKHFIQTPLRSPWNKMIAIIGVLTLTVVGVCSADSSEIPKCELEQWFNMPTNSCVPAGQKGSRPFCKNVTYTIEEFDGLDKNIQALVNGMEGDGIITLCFPFTSRFMKCPRWAFVEDEFRVIDGGRRLSIHSPKKIYSTGDFTMRETSDGPEAIVCVSEESLAAENDNDRRFKPLYLYSAAWAISAASLIVAFFLCVAVRGLSTYRVVMPCFVGSLFFAYAVMLTRAFGPAPSLPVCFTYAVALQFSFLSAFFWLNVIAFDIWRSVTSPVVKPGYLRLFAYLAFGWGCPILMVGTAVAFDQTTDLGIASSFRPRFQENCWFRRSPAIIAFFYGPIATVLVINFVFFVLTLFAVKTKLNQTNAPHSNTSLWRLSLELAVVMGLCWSMEVVSWAVGGDLSNWYFTDTLNGLQGLFVLIVIARKPSVIRWLMRSMGRKSEKGDVEEGSTVTYIHTQDCKKEPK